MILGGVEKARRRAGSVGGSGETRDPRPKKEGANGGKREAGAVGIGASGLSKGQQKVTGTG